jgi:Heat induced stress protein YflT
VALFLLCVRVHTNDNSCKNLPKKVRRNDMAMTQRSIVVGVFPELAQARDAIAELRRAGFSEDEIGFLTRADTLEPENEQGARIASDAAGGGIIGGTVGAVAALLIPGFGPAIAGGILIAMLGGAAIGAAAGGIIGSLTELGVPEKEARFYQKELEAGYPIVTVKTATGHDEAVEILRRNGAYDAKTQSGVINAVPPQRPYGGTPPETSDPNASSSSGTAG